jgi:hypothetical protein
MADAQTLTFLPDGGWQRATAMIVIGPTPKPPTGWR